MLSRFANRRNILVGQPLHRNVWKPTKWGYRLVRNLDAGKPSIALDRLVFSVDQPWLQVVNEKLFRDSMRYGGRHFSPLLLNCVLALGSRYCDRMKVRSDPNVSNTAGKMCLKRAEALLQNDLRCPNIATIQSLAIMGMIYIVRCYTIDFPMSKRSLTLHRPWDMMPLGGCTRVWRTDWPSTWG